jgi:hypothetical protein
MSELVDHLAIHKTTTAIWQPEAYSDLARAVGKLKRDLRSRDLRDVRPARPNWIVPDLVGFSLEGKGRKLASRKSHLCTSLGDLTYDGHRSPAQRKALERVAELITSSRSHPTWLYWYSPQTIALVRRSSYETRFEVNKLATETLRRMGIDTTIACWEEAIGVVSRRLPLGLVVANSPSRRCTHLIRNLERLGVLTLGGLTTMSTDSVEFLHSVKLKTLEACSNALKDGHQRRAL